MNRSEETKTYIRLQKPFLFFLWQFCKSSIIGFQFNRHQNLSNHIHIILTRYDKNIFKSIISYVVRVIPFRISCEDGADDEF